MFTPTFEIEGLPELAKRLDEIASAASGPITKHALQAGGAIIQARAEELVHKLTGTLSKDIVVVTRVRGDGREQYVLIGPGYNADVYRRVAHNRGASGREAQADYATNPGIYGLFLEVGHRAPNEGLAHNQQYRRDAAASRKQGKQADTSKYGNLSTPPYPWLGPAFEQTKDEAMETAAEVIKTELEGQGL